MAGLFLANPGEKKIRKRGNAEDIKENGSGGTHTQTPKTKTPKILSVQRHKSKEKLRKKGKKIGSSKDTLDGVNELLLKQS